MIKSLLFWNYCRFLNILHKYLILQFNSFALYRENMKLQIPNFYHSLIYEYLEYEKDCCRLGLEFKIFICIQY